jgi:membrane associated rhomboid family serine protease
MLAAVGGAVVRFWRGRAAGAASAAASGSLSGVLALAMVHGRLMPARPCPFLHNPLRTARAHTQTIAMTCDVAS